MTRALRIILAALLYALIGQIIHSVGALVEMPYYLDPNYFSVWSKLMMPGVGPPPATFFLYSFTLAVIVGLILAGVYSIVAKALHGTQMERGFSYGVLIFFIAGLPGAFSLYLLINLPTMLIVYWTIENLIAYLISGILFGKLIST